MSSSGRHSTRICICCRRRSLRTFLFNTLANVQALVDAGSPHASAVLRSLIAYLRAAVPVLHETAATIEREVQLVRPYLELMQMRMPDRLQYAMNVDPSALKVRCPPTTLLTLVENAVRHGIDPSEEGGRIDIEIERLGERCVVRVTDTGAGLHPVGEWSRDRAHDSARAAAADLRRCRASAPRIRRTPRRRRRSRSAGTDMNARATALIADDEPLLRDALRRQLANVWPELEIVAEARNGREAVRLFDERHPDICFLDVHMPGLSGVDAANHIGRRAHLVFVTAYDHYAVQAFAQGALDYLLKPVERGAARRNREPPEGTSAVIAARDQYRAALAATQRAAREDAGRQEGRAAAMDSGTSRENRAPHHDRGRRLPSLGREVHTRRLARWRKTRRGGGADAAQGPARAARFRAIRAGPSIGRRESARDQPCEAT